MKKDDQVGGVKAAKGINPAESIFMRELDLLGDKEKIGRILSRFNLYSSDILQLDLEETDRALLWLVNVLTKTHLARNREESDNLWNLVVQLKNIYRELSIQYDSKWLFPKTKKAILRFILDQWNVTRYDNICHQEIFMFIRDIYIDEHPLEERKAIDILIKERLKDAATQDIEKWMMWIVTTIQKIDAKKGYRSIHEDLTYHFILARARSSSFNRVVQDIRDREIVSTLNVGHVDDDMLCALSTVCNGQMRLRQEISRCVQDIGRLLSLSEREGEKIYFKFRCADDIAIFLIKKPKVEANQKQHNQTVLKEVVEEMKELDLLTKTGESAFFEGRRLTLELSVSGKNGEWLVEKKWSKEE